MLPPDAPLGERILWAALSVIVGLAHDGPGVTDVERFGRIEASCRSFSLGDENLDALAKRFNFHYYRPWDCYVGRDEWLEMTLRDACITSQARSH